MCCWIRCARWRRWGGRPTVVVLTPAFYNSAYFAFLAQQMGVGVEGKDLFVDDHTRLHENHSGARAGWT